ncbi:helix-turn-helix transcriptional regulator [Bordetella sp. 2513F-2]
MNDEAVLIAQRQLRHQLLDDKRSIQWARARDLAAHLLIRLDDVKACWQFGTEWLLAEMSADRITAGPCDSRRVYYSPRFESLHPDKQVPSLKGARFEIADASMRRILLARQAVAFTDLPVNSVACAKTEFGHVPPVAVKLGMALREGGIATGMICAHWLDQHQRPPTDHCIRLTTVVNEVFNPVLLAAKRLADASTPAEGHEPKRAAQTGSLSTLTPAELRLAHLAATGMSYKEIARQLNRSFSTVDHHLRSIRKKFKVHSSARLITLLAAEFSRTGDDARSLR